MTMYYHNTLVCNHCLQDIRGTGMMSINMTEAVFWTDGKVTGPLIYDDYNFAQCPYCNEGIWLDELIEKANSQEKPIKKNISTIEILTTADKLIEGNVILELSPIKPDKAFIEQYMIDHGNLPREKDIYLRTQIWWMANDLFREHKQIAPIGLKDTYAEKQLKVLFTLVNKRKIIAAEIQRQLGDFDHCLYLIDRLPEKEKTDYALFIKKLAENNIPGVAPVEDYVYFDI